MGGWNLFCYDHRLQPVGWLLFIVFTIGAGFASIQSAWLPELFWAKSNSSNPPPNMPTAKDIAEKPTSLRSGLPVISIPHVALAKPVKKEEHHVLSLKERTLQLETRLDYFGVTRSRMLKTLPSDRIPFGGYSPDDLAGNQEIEAQTLQLFQKDFLPECISIMSEFRSRGFNVIKLRQQITDVIGEGFEFRFIAGELQLLAAQLDPTDQNNP